MGLMKNKKKNILITGGSGFLAKNLALKFNKKFNVILFSRNLDNLKKIASETNSDYFAGDITRIDSLRDVLVFITLIQLYIQPPQNMLIILKLIPMNVLT